MQIDKDERVRRFCRMLDGLSHESLTSQSRGTRANVTIRISRSRLSIQAKRCWKTESNDGMSRRMSQTRDATLRSRKHLRYVRYLDDFPAFAIDNIWTDTEFGGVRDRQDLRCSNRPTRLFERCILMTTDPGDLVLDPTCGSGTTAYRRRAMGPPLDHD